MAGIWQGVYSELYSVLEVRYESLVNNKIEYTSISSMHGEWVATVDEVATALVEQKKGKATGQDKILEAFMYGGQRILIYVVRCFSLFLKFGFIP